MMKLLGLMGLILCLLLVQSMPAVGASKGILRFLKPTYKKAKVPIVLVAFGTSTKAQVTFDFIDKKVHEAFPDREIRWAFTSRIIRNKMNKHYKDKGVHKKLHSLPQVLAAFEAEGYRKAVVQSLHVFPGEEYVHMQNQAVIDGIDVAIGEPLFATWEDVMKVLEALSKEVPTPEQGCAVLAGHGSPNTYAAPSTAVYLAFDRLLQTHYKNVFLGSVEGVPDRTDALEKAKAYKGDRVQIIPLMLVAGDHVMNDIMGQEPDGQGEPSWAMEIQQAGKLVSCPTVEIDGKTYYKGLGFYDEVVEIIIEHIHQALSDLE